MFIWLTLCEPGPPPETLCWGNSPASHLSPRYPHAPPGPNCHLFCPSRELVAVGKIKVGPSPSSQGPASLGLGESNAARMVSPKRGTRWRFPLGSTAGTLSSQRPTPH